MIKETDKYMIHLNIYKLLIILPFHPLASCLGRKYIKMALKKYFLKNK